MNRVRARRLSRWSQKKPVLWPPGELDAEPDAVLGLIVTRGGSFGRGDGPAGEVFGQGDPLVDVDPEVPRAEPFGRPFEDRADPLVHPEAEDLDGEDVVEAVDDQAGEAVGLGVDHPIGVRSLRRA